MTTERNLTVNDLSIHALASGNGDKAIVFVHGNSSNAESWKLQLADSKLTGNYKLIAYDLPGCGKSGRSDSYDMQALADNLRSVVKELNIKEYILVGLSYGTCIVGEAAPNLPGCKGIMLVSSNITNNEHNPGTFLNPFPELAATVLASADDEVLMAFAKRLLPDPTSPFIQEYIASYKQTDPNFRVAIGAAMAVAGWSDEFANVSNMRVPVCVVFGKEEQVIQTNYLDGFPGKWRDKVFHIENATHFVNIEQPGAFNELLLEFANDVFIEYHS